MPVSDNLGLARRDELELVVNNNYTPSSVYIPAVGCINQALKAIGVGLSSQVLASITDNMTVKRLIRVVNIQKVNLLTVNQSICPRMVTYVQKSTYTSRYI